MKNNCYELITPLILLSKLTIKNLGCFYLIFFEKYFGKIGFKMIAVIKKMLI